MKIKIIDDNLNGNEIRHLLQTHFNLMRSQSPEESCHVLPIDDLKAPNIKFWSAWVDENLVGCGALKDLSENHGEIKSMHVYQALRGNGYSKEILKFIIKYAIENGFVKLSLETGAQPEFKAARSLYEKAGFVTCPPFGEYKIDPLSAFYTLSI